MDKKTSGKASSWLASETKSRDSRGIGAIYREVVATPVDEKDKAAQTEEPSTTDNFKKSQDDDTQGFTSISQ